MHIPKCILYKIPIDLELEPVINLHVNKPKKKCRHKSRSCSCKRKCKSKSKSQPNHLVDLKKALRPKIRHQPLGRLLRNRWIQSE